MLTAITNYLIIYIQFNSLSPRTTHMVGIGINGAVKSTQSTYQPYSKNDLDI